MILSPVAFKKQTGVIVTAVVLILLPSCAFSMQAVAPRGVGSGKFATVEPDLLGQTAKFYHCGNLFARAQFSGNDIETPMEKNMERVISLRTKGELDRGEKQRAKSAGIELAQAENQKQAQDDIKRNQDSDGAKSVKPGINAGFLDPELDVDRYVKRFEVESREIYLAREQIVEACSITSGMTIADVGAGTGLFTRLFSKQLAKSGWVYAVDIAPRFLDHIRQQANSEGLKNITMTLCSEDSVNLPPESVDLVFICDTYHHFEFPGSTMKSISRALKKDGKLVLIDFERIPGTTREWLMNHVRAGKDVFRAEVQDSGFALVEEKKISELRENYFLVFKKN